MPVAPNTAIDQPQEFWSRHPNPHIRVAGRDASAGAVAAAASQREHTHFRLLPCPADVDAEDDYTQIDPTLPLARDGGAVADPLPHTSYAGLTPVQRRRFANWLTSPEVAAADAFRRLYLAWLEIALFEEDRQTAARAELAALLGTAGWRTEEGLGQTTLLAGWLAQDGGLIAQAIAHAQLAPWLLTTGIGWLARLGQPLDGGSALALAQGWNIHAPGLSAFDREKDGALLELRIASLTNALGREPLAWALAHLSPVHALGGTGPDEGSQVTDEWHAWHPVHRQLRLLLPRIDLRPLLESRLAELFAALPVAVNQPVAEANSPEISALSRPHVHTDEWLLILEFGNSRSQHYDYAIHLARKQPGYQLLMDETRQLIHRIRFRKRHIRQFWRLWAYVESWSSTKVYVNGEEVQKWNVYPYSAEMR